ncbi:MAG: hypothetical protein JO347_01840 [Candidatus Eremiobacteraeota bacterium]|nr:hypothetical protein [Candidatus Eremiobacteraeota bacterium]
MASDTGHSSAASEREQGAHADLSEVGEALKNGPKGALVVSAIAVGILFVGWIAFYFLLFMPRGPIG